MGAERARVSARRGRRVLSCTESRPRTRGRRRTSGDEEVGYEQGTGIRGGITRRARALQHEDKENLPTGMVWVYTRSSLNVDWSDPGKRF